MSTVIKTKLAIGQFSKALKNKIESDQCYQNSLYVISAYPYADIEYVEGVVNTPNGDILHVWNCYEGKYFDTTWECHLPKLIDCPRKILIQGTLQDLRQQGYSFTPYWLPLSEQVI